MSPRAQNPHSARTATQVASKAATPRPRRLSWGLRGCPALALITTVQLLGSTAVAGLIIPIDPKLAGQNGDIIINKNLDIDTGTVNNPATTFAFMGTTYTGRVVNQAGGPSIVVYDFNTFNLQKTLTIEGADPIAFLALNKNNAEFGIDISGKLLANGFSGDSSASGGAGGGTGGAENRAGANATGAMTGAGGTGDPRLGGAGGGGGFGGAGGMGAVGGNATGNTKGGAGGGTYGTKDMAVLFGGGGGGGGRASAGRSGSSGGGGGGVLIESMGKIRISGTVSANGGPGGDTKTISGGGGAGGGIIIEAEGGKSVNNSVVITGTVTANGGAGGSSGGNFFYQGGGGGGGRIFISDPMADLSKVFVAVGAGGGNNAEKGDTGTVMVGSVPEPSSWLLALIGLGFVAWQGKQSVPVQNKREAAPDTQAPERIQDDMTFHHPGYSSCIG
jgi:PEP-CTERM motif